MLEFIHDRLRRVASFIRFAQHLNQEELLKILRNLEKFVNHNPNFDPASGNVLNLSPEGLKNLKSIWPDFKEKNMKEVLHRLDSAIELAGKFGDEHMAYLHKRLSKEPKWSRIDFSRADVKDRISDAIAEAIEMAEKPIPRSTITPEELQEMKERGII